MKKQQILTIDLGGTKISGAVFKKEEDKYKIIKYKKKEYQNLKEEITFFIDAITKNVKIDEIIISTAGPADYKKGILKNPANIKTKNFNIKKYIQDKYKIKVYVFHDSESFTKYQSIKHKEYSSILSILFGTGIGYALSIKQNNNHQIYRGKGNAGELSHVIINSKEVEQYYKEIPKNHKQKSYRDIFQKIEKNEINQFEKNKIIEELSDILSTATYNGILAYDPELIVLSGSVTKARKYFYIQYKQKLKEKLQKYSIQTPKIIIDTDSKAILNGSIFMKENQIKK